MSDYAFRDHAAAKEAGGYPFPSPRYQKPSRSKPSHQDQLYTTMTQDTLSPDLFERLYGQPKMPVKGELRKTIGNPTPLGLMGLAVCLTPLAIDLMGWRGSGGHGVASGTATLWFGGLFLVLAGLLEFLLGNTFSFMVWMGYGGHFLTYATTFMPQYNAIGYFSGDVSSEAGLTPMFESGFGQLPSPPVLIPSSLTLRHDRILLPVYDNLVDHISDLLCSHRLCTCRNLHVRQPGVRSSDWSFLYVGGS